MTFLRVNYGDEIMAAGTVESVADGLARVRLDLGAGGCGCGGKCGGEKHAAVVDVLTRIPLVAGDRVRLLKPLPLRASWSLFGLPLVLMLGLGFAGQGLGAALGLTGGAAEFVAAAGGLAGLLGGLLFTARRARRGSRAVWWVTGKL